MGLHPGAYHHGVERLGDVVDPAHLEADGFLLPIAESGDENDGDLAGTWIGLQAAANLEAV